MTESDDTDTHRRECRYCTETLPPGAIECPLCLRAVADARKASQISSVSGNRHLAAVPSAGSSMAGAGTPQVAAVVHSSAESPDSGAVYTLESQVKCPGCEADISTLHVIRGLRTQVSFTSTLPRKAYVIACPSCRQLLSAGLSGVF